MVKIKKRFLLESLFCIKYIDSLTVWQAFSLYLNQPFSFDCLIASILFFTSNLSKIIDI